MVKSIGILNEEEAFNKLREMGYKDLYIWEDSPGTSYNWHTHPNNEIRYILKGTILIKVKENNQIKEYLLKPGELLEVKQNTLHNAYTEEGVRYICGSK
ncbi:MAG: cupin domain-containing protein [Candidatus Calescibacterium sp.]|nr:cupin domain-containing protein [Candidatus Calescibacterium sp.]MCX7972528.1 cupin domain-containing protein [bacterium]MDW8195579.1 cupin domain-containing protein [Candidatus Calescibacterium sp.]